MLSNPVVKLAPKCDKCCISNPGLLSENSRDQRYLYMFLHFYTSHLYSDINRCYAEVNDWQCNFKKLHYTSKTHSNHS